VWLDTNPLGIAEVGLVCFSHHARHPTGSLHHNPFSDSFEGKFSEVDANYPLHSRGPRLRSDC
jgi:hypothetical protein